MAVFVVPIPNAKKFNLSNQLDEILYLHKKLIKLLCRPLKLLIKCYLVPLKIYYNLLNLRREIDYACINYVMVLFSVFENLFIKKVNLST